jgi:hypothetical protein
MSYAKVLIGSPIRQKPNILKEFFISLKNLKHEGIIVDFILIDDNTIQESTALIKSFNIEGSKIYLFNTSEAIGEYICNEESHNWNYDLMLKVALLKDTIIQNSISMNYDYLFLIDSDLILHPNTLINLLERKKDIVSEIFWTQWSPNQVLLPQVWLYDKYSMYDTRNSLSENEMVKEIYKFLDMLKKPGIYKVGGLGACTLISNTVLKAGICFKEIYNLTIPGEDRHFCIRAAALGFELFVDTVYPAFHIYRESLLDDCAYVKKEFGYLN